MTNLHPGLIMIAFGILIMVMPKKASRWVVLLGSAVSAGTMFFLEPGAELNYKFVGKYTLELINLDQLSYCFCLVFVVISLIAAIFQMANGESSKWEKAMSLIYAGSGISVVLAKDWISFIGFWELMALSSIFIVWAGDTCQSRRSSFRYMIMHLFGGNLLLAGAVMAFSGGEIEIAKMTGEGGPAYWLILMGILVNCAMPPFHTWVPDSYPVAKPEGTLYMGSFTTKVAVYALIRMYSGTLWLGPFAAVVAVFAAMMALIENDLRKLLSYHIISQLGMMVAAVSVGSAVGDAGAALHAAFNILYKGVLLMAAGSIFYSTAGVSKITDLGGLRKKMPITFACFFVCSLAIAGVPLLNGFVSKALIMEALEDGGQKFAYIMVMAAGVGTWLSITMKINYFVFMGDEYPNLKVEKVPFWRQLAMVIGTLLCIITGVMPSISYKLFSMSTASLFAPAHVLEYVGLFIGASIPFVLLLNKMAPHKGINLDLDWLYRRLLPEFVFGVSKQTRNLFDIFAEATTNFNRSVSIFLRNPKVVFGFSNELDEDDEDQTRPIGEMVHVLVLFCIIALIVIFTME